jgi:hypothetical protein
MNKNKMLNLNRTNAHTIMNVQRVIKAELIKRKSFRLKTSKHDRIIKESSVQWIDKALCLFVSLVMSLLLLTSAHAAKNEVSAIFQQLSAAPVVRAQFQQHKKLADLNKTFSSSGSVVFSKQQGVLWQIDKPVQASLVVTPEKLVQKTQRTFSQVDMAKSPYGSVANMFLQLMSGNEAALAKNFSVVSASYTANQWNLTLVPKSALFKKLFVQVNAQGQRYVDQIVITEKANNSTTIYFKQHSTQPSTLTASENELFKLAK